MREKEKEYFPHKEEICILIMCVRLKEVWAEVENEGLKRLSDALHFAATQIPYLIKTILKNGHKMVSVPAVPKPVLCLVY